MNRLLDTSSEARGSKDTTQKKKGILHRLFGKKDGNKSAESSDPSSPGTKAVAARSSSKKYGVSNLFGMISGKGKEVTATVDEEPDVMGSKADKCGSVELTMKYISRKLVSVPGDDYFEKVLNLYKSIFIYVYL